MKQHARRHDTYKKIIDLLVEPKTSNQIASELNITNGSIANMLKILTNIDYVKREKIDGLFFYTRLIEQTTTAEVYAKNKVPNPKLKLPTLPGARVIDFDNADLRRKLKETQDLTNENRKSSKNYVKGETLSWF